MKHIITITSLLAAGTLCASAASIGYNSMSDAQKEDVVFAWDFSSGSVDFAAGSVEMGSSQYTSETFTLTGENTATVGTQGTRPWSSRVSGIGESFTLSLDVNAISSWRNWNSIVSLYSDQKSINFDHTMALTTNGDSLGTLVLQSGLGGETAYAGAGNHTLSTGLLASDVHDTTFTIVSNAVLQTLTLYVNGLQTDQLTGWIAGTESSLALTGFQFGSNFSNCDQIGNATVSNITFWNKALSAEEVSSLIPEPSAFGLLAGLGALALAGTRRRRRKA